MPDLPPLPQGYKPVDETPALPKGYRPAALGTASPAPTPLDTSKVGSPDQQQQWYDQTVSYRKTMSNMATMAGAAAVPGVGLLSTPLRVAFMGVMGAGADAYGQIISRVLGMPAPKTGGAAAKEIAGEGAMQAGAELGGAAVGAVAGKVGATAAKARELIATATKYDMPISGAEAAGGGLSRVTQSLGQSMLFGKSHFLRMQTKFFAGLNVAVEDTVATFGSQMTQANAGTAIKDGLSIAKSKFHEMSSGLYEGLLSRVEQATGKAPIVNFSKAATDEAKKVAEELGQVVTKYPQIMKENPEVAKILGELAPQTRYGVPAARMTETPLPSLTVREAQALRSRLRDMMRESNDPSLKRLATRFEKVVDGGMRDALDKLPSGAQGKTLKGELDDIDATYRKGQELFQGKAYSALVEKYPEQIAHSVGLQDVTAMKDVRDSLLKYANKPEQWDLFRRMWVQDKIGAAELTDAEPGQVLAKGVTNLYDALSSKSKPMADEFFSDAKGKVFLDNLKKISDITKSKVGLNVRSDSHMFINYGLLHGLLTAGLLAETHMPALALTAMVPSAMVRVMYNKEATNLVVGAMEAAGKTGAALSAPQLAQVARGIRLALQGYDIAKDQKRADIGSGRAGQ